MSDTDANLEAIDRLTQAIRAVVRHAFDQDKLTNQEIGAALIYELAALVAAEVGPGPLADRLVAAWADVMRTQIRSFRTLREHP